MPLVVWRQALAERVAWLVYQTPSLPRLPCHRWLDGRRRCQPVRRRLCLVASDLGARQAEKQRLLMALPVELPEVALGRATHREVVQPFP